jgi:hypothetical protein
MINDAETRRSDPKDARSAIVPPRCRDLMITPVASHKCLAAWIDPMYSPRIRQRQLAIVREKFDDEEYLCGSP